MEEEVIRDYVNRTFLCSDQTFIVKPKKNVKIIFNPYGIIIFSKREIYARIPYSYSWNEITEDMMQELIKMLKECISEL